MASDKALIVLQENSGVTPLDSGIPPIVRDQIRAIIDRVAEKFEDIKLSLQGSGHYDVIHLLTDNRCTRTALLNTLVDETQKGRTIDLIVLGHGTPEKLKLKRTPHLTGGEGGKIRSLLPDAQAKGVDEIRLRMVYMCNCYGSTVNDDWLAMGAQVSVGARAVNWMPEPMTTYFVHYWLAGETAEEAARKAYERTKLFYLPIFPPTPRITYKDVEKTYPCPTWEDPSRTCTKRFQVPDGVEFIPHTNVKQSELVVAGDTGIVF